MDGFCLAKELLYDVPLCDDSLENQEGSMKYLRAGEVQYVEAVAEQMYRNNRFGEKHCARLLALFAGTCGNLKVPRAPERDLPWVTRYFSYYMAGDEGIMDHPRNSVG